MKSRRMITNIGTINLAELDLINDSLEVFIPIIAISESLKATIEENVQKAKEEHQKKFLDCRGMKWNDAGITMDYQALHVIAENRELHYELCFDFEDKKDSSIWTGFSLDVDLSEHTTELKKLILHAAIDKFFE